MQNQDNRDKLNKALYAQLRTACSAVVLAVNPKKQLEKAFKKWQERLLVEKVMKRNITSSSVHHLRNAMLKDSDKYNEVIKHSSNISFLEQQIHNKMTSFMTINKFLIKHYIGQGTILQKHIDAGKLLAKRQIQNQKKIHLLGAEKGGQLHKVTYSAYQVNLQFQLEQKEIEDQINNITHTIRRIVFNKWLLFTQFQIKHDHKPKNRGCTCIFSTMERIL